MTCTCSHKSKCRKEVMFDGTKFLVLGPVEDYMHVDWIVCGIDVISDSAHHVSSTIRHSAVSRVSDRNDMLTSYLIRKDKRNRYWVTATNLQLGQIQRSAGMCICLISLYTVKIDTLGINTEYLHLGLKPEKSLEISWHLHPCPSSYYFGALRASKLFFFIPGLSRSLAFDDPVCLRRSQYPWRQPNPRQRDELERARRTKTIRVRKKLLSRYLVRPLAFLDNKANINYLKVDATATLTNNATTVPATCLSNVLENNNPLGATTVDASRDALEAGSGIHTPTAVNQSGAMSKGEATLHTVTTAELSNGTLKISPGNPTVARGQQIGENTGSDSNFSL